jgi:REP-associated tyrosine transposase
MSHPQRLYPGVQLNVQQYLLTICATHRRAEFADAGTVALVSTQFLRTAKDEEVAVLAYCFMPDRLHALVSSWSDQEVFERFVHLVRLRSGLVFFRATGRQLWHPGFFGRQLRPDERVPDIVKGLVGYPLRAGLVAELAAYPHWGSQVYSREEILDLVAEDCRV